MKLSKWPEALPREGNQQFKKMKSISQWFEIYQINQETYAILEPNHSEEVFSFLVLGKNKGALIDTGMGIGNIFDEVKQLTQLPILVINTHTHFDHTGDNFRFKEIGCFDHEYELNNLAQGHANQFCKDFMSPQDYFDLPKNFDPKKYHIKPSCVTHQFKHLDQVDLGDRSLIIHHTPGHSPGSICIEDTKYHILFTGDTYYAGNIFIDLPGSNQQDFFKSIQYLNTIIENIDFLCPSHNIVYASKEVLISLKTAQEKIENQEVQSKVHSQSITYYFDEFTLRLPSR
ncbi:MAG: MBL fold metallo-hydrolase [Spirochaetes bacterium]|nr:MBL fold metallo-hydrolase [Spirochaetota bacterium]